MRIALLLLAACGGSSESSVQVKTGEELLAPWVSVKLGAPPGDRPGFVALPGQLLLSAPDQATELNLEAGHVAEVAIEWRGDAASAAEQQLRGRLPSPRECAGAHREIAEWKPLLWQLPDGSSVSAMRKGKTYRVSVRRPATQVFLDLYATCLAP